MELTPCDAALIAQARKLGLTLEDLRARGWCRWIENTEGAKFWMKVFNDLKTRGVADILIAVTDG